MNIEELDEKILNHRRIAEDQNEKARELERKRVEILSSPEIEKLAEMMHKRLNRNHRGHRESYTNSAKAFWCEKAIKLVNETGLSAGTLTVVFSRL